MSLKEQFQEMDIERVLLVPVFVFLLGVTGSVSYSYARAHSLTEVTTILILVHKGLLICFYLLVIALFFMRSQATLILCAAFY